MNAIAALFKNTFSLDIDRTKRILALALPIIGGMVSQNIINLVDIGMVGKLGTTSLAAVGIGGVLSFLSAAFIMGVSVGVQAIAARRKGEKNYQDMAVALNAGLLLVTIISPILSIILYNVTPIFFPLMHNDQTVINLGIPYLQIRIIGILFIGINFAFRGYWSGTDRSKFYMYALILINISNVLLNYILIFGNWGAPSLGVKGAAIASVLALLIGNIFYIILGTIYARKSGFLKKWPTSTDLRSLLNLSFPSGIQQFFFAAGYAAFYWIIGKVGTRELAAANVLINILMVAIFPSMGLGMASATLVSQALGRKDPDDAYQWAFDVLKIGLILLILIGLPFWLIPDLILSIFLHDTATLIIARLPLMVMGLTIIVEAGIMVFMQSLLGAGDNKRVMFVSIFSHWLLFLPLAYFIGPFMGNGLLSIWIAQCIYRFTLAFSFFILWRQRRWQTIVI